MTATVFVVGHRGMLGHVVARRAAERGFRVATSAARYVCGTRDPLVEEVRESGADIVINCLGRTERAAVDPHELMVANALFPVHLAARLPRQQYLIHASTDCVFAPTGGHPVSDECDATDPYGVSKLLGEAVALRPNVTVVRVSVVGPSPSNGRGLLEWFLRHPSEASVPGWTNHRWNGVTSLDWADFALDLAESQLRGGPVPSVSQPGTQVISKHDLLCAFRDAFASGQLVHPIAAPEVIDRSLVPTDLRPAIAQQLQQLAGWYPMVLEPCGT